MEPKESGDDSKWIKTLPKPIRYFLVFGSFVGGIAMLLVGATRLITPPDDASVVHWLSGAGFVFMGPLLVWQAIILFGRK